MKLKKVWYVVESFSCGCPAVALKKFVTQEDAYHFVEALSNHDFIVPDNAFRVIEVLEPNERS